MLNYAETTGIRTDVVVPGPDMVDHLRGTPALHSLSALLAHPEFQRGLAGAQEDFSSDYKAAPLTEEEMVNEVEMNLTRRVTERDSTAKNLSRHK
ncbi:MAG: hypothetical protein H0W02_11220 [Ktedonobacteraceae bacterium]|nr:hypothetical protein [Ktedonobacteraceae bacterium]